MTPLHPVRWNHLVLAAVFALLTACAAPSSPPAEPASGGLTGDYFTVPQLTQKPVVVTKVSPDYPARLRRMGVRGEAVITFVVETDGSVREAEALGRPAPTEDEREFDTAALAAVRQWKFIPGEKDGVPVRVILRVPFGFGGQ